MVFCVAPGQHIAIHLHNPAIHVRDAVEWRRGVAWYVLSAGGAEKGIGLASRCMRGGRSSRYCLPIRIYWANGLAVERENAVPEDKEKKRMTKICAMHFTHQILI